MKLREINQVWPMRRKTGESPRKNTITDQVWKARIILWFLIMNSIIKISKEKK